MSSDTARHAARTSANANKFIDPDITAKGDPRAQVGLKRLDTLWINTGSLCNITCRNCYIKSSPTNDDLAYLTAAEVAGFLDEAQHAGTRDIGFTGGEPFLNPDFLAMLEDALARGFDTLVLTNAMRPMQRPRIAEGLLALAARFGDRLTFRVSLDHHTAKLHETERGPETFEPTLAGIDWLVGNGFAVAIAARSCWGETEADARAGYAHLFAARGWPIDAADPSRLVLFPEMDLAVEVPEITTACWSILGLSPEALMCASSRMVVKRKGAARPTVLPCTLLPYEPAFEMGATLAEAAAADGGMFAAGAVKLCHPHCAKFCVLGGGSCS
ncbi:MAG: radical SAM protein [Hyphomicrobiaceae bacterium]|nr:radical SAM protein [Hyphomicrobiaceae bacterium]